MTTFDHRQGPYRQRVQARDVSREGKLATQREDVKHLQGDEGLIGKVKIDKGEGAGAGGAGICA
jgi:hypothetical protein